MGSVQTRRRCRGAARWLALGLGWAALAGCAPLHPLPPLGQAVDPDWSPDQFVLARVEFHDPTVTVHHVRNCAYRTHENYTVLYEDRAYDLREIEAVDFIVVPFPEMPALAHTMLSFAFRGEQHVAVSVEVRKHDGDDYSALLGALGYFDLIYVVGDERDLIGVRSNHWLSEVYLYRTLATPDQARRLFLDVMHRVNDLAEKPERYHTLTNNCTTNIVRHVNNVFPNRVPYGVGVLLPGFSDRLAYDLGLVDTSRSFEETRRRALITQQTYRYRNDPEFSKRIRQPIE